MSSYGLDGRFRVVLADVDEELLEMSGDPTAIRLDPDGSIPLGDRSIDVAVSSDVFEHVAPDRRAHWAAELRRVARLGQAHTFPADSRDGRWASTATDRQLDAWHRHRFGVPERWTAEHLSHEQPLVEAMLELFPGATARGFANAEVWLEMLKGQLDPRGPFARLRFALGYATRKRRLDQRPPFKACLLTA